MLLYSLAGSPKNLNFLRICTFHISLISPDGRGDGVNEPEKRRVRASQGRLAQLKPTIVNWIYLSRASPSILVLQSVSSTFRRICCIPAIFFLLIKKLSTFQEKLGRKFAI
jgi:hypothetical protein